MGAVLSSQPRIPGISVSPGCLILGQCQFKQPLWINKFPSFHGLISYKVSSKRKKKHKKLENEIGQKGKKQRKQEHENTEKKVFSTNTREKIVTQKKERELKKKTERKKRWRASRGVSRWVEGASSSSSLMQTGN